MRYWVIAGLMCAVATSAATAGPLATDSNAYSDGTTVWRGTVSLSFQESSGDWLEADVDYCVYGPGSFSYGSYIDSLGSSYTPAADEFVYAYQVHALGDCSVTSLSVEMLPSNEADAIGTFEVSSSDEYVPGIVAFLGPPADRDQAYWDFGSMYEPGSSLGLAFVSVNAPIWTNGTIMNGGGSVTDDLPSPSDVIPEPATLCLLGFGGLALVVRRRRTA